MIDKSYHLFSVGDRVVKRDGNTVYSRHKILIVLVQIPAREEHTFDSANLQI